MRVGCAGGSKRERIIATAHVAACFPAGFPSSFSVRRPAGRGNNMPMRKPFRAAVNMLALLVVCLLAGIVPAADDPNPARAEAELKAVRAQMDRVRAEMERDAGRRDKLSR